MFAGELKTDTIDHANFVAPSRSSVNPSFPSQKELNPYVIIDSKPHVDKLKGKKGQPDIERRGILFTTRAKGQWFVIPPFHTDRLRREPDVPYLNGAGEALWERQRFNPVNPEETAHTDNVLFLAANPEQTARNVYYHQRPKVRIHTRLRSLVEVDMSDLLIVRQLPDMQVEEVCGRSDVAVVGPDGQVLMTELSKSGINRKSRQITRHSMGFETVIRQANHGKVPPIKRFVGIYERPRENYNVLHIRAAIAERVGEYADALVQPNPFHYEIFDGKRHHRSLAAD